MSPIIPQIIGIVAVVTFLLGYLQKKRKNIILLNVTSRILYILQYLLLGAFSGAVLDVLGTVSSVIAGKKDSAFIKKHTKLIFVSVNLSMIVAGGVIAWYGKGLLDVLPIIGVLLHTSAFWMTEEKKIRLVSLAGSPFWFVYNLLSRAYGSSVGDILSICSIVIAMVRYGDFKRGKEEK